MVGYAPFKVHCGACPGGTCLWAFTNWHVLGIQSRWDILPVVIKKKKISPPLPYLLPKLLPVRPVLVSR
jgi:hypothetical protein